MREEPADICIIGMGPAGLGAALQALRAPRQRKIVCIEAGVEPEQRYCAILDRRGCRRVQPCQVTGGIGGASLLSAGKISSYPAGRGMAALVGDDALLDARLRSGLELFREYIPLASSDISKDQQDAASSYYHHRGLEYRYYDAQRYRKVDMILGYRRMLSDLIARGTEIRLNTRVVDITATEGKYYVRTISKGEEQLVAAERIVIAVGRTGTGLMTRIRSSLDLTRETGGCDVGVRLEFPSSLWPSIDQDHNDLKLHFGNARTFCVCKEGRLAPYRLDDMFLLEGFSDPDFKTGFSNLAIVLRVDPNPLKDRMDILGEVKERLLAQTKGVPVRQRLDSYLSGTNQIGSERTPASITYWRWGNAHLCFPTDVAEALQQAVGYFVERIFSPTMYSSISVFAPELDYYWPRFRLLPGFSTFQSGVFLAGDCSGHFRGILQAFSSGLMCSEQALLHDHVS